VPQQADTRKYQIVMDARYYAMGRCDLLKRAKTRADAAHPFVHLTKDRADRRRSSAA